jgi:hypothetical protein
VRLYSYVIDRDYGFAPNPFYGVCSLGTCKPVIRRKASIGDWVVGTGGARTKRTGRLIYAMKVSETMTFDEYFVDPRFQLKKPNLSGSLKQCFGDNIYSRDADGEWQQLDSHHSLQDGSPNIENLATDTGTNRVLISTHFAYFGADAPMLPHDLQSRGPGGICAGRHHRVNFEPGVETAFLDWFVGLGMTGQNGTPFEWLRNGALRK